MMRTLAAAATLSAGVLVSCSQLEDSQTGEGYLLLSDVCVDVTVEMMGSSKASYPTVTAPSVEDLHYRITAAGGDVHYDRTGLWSGAIVLPTGHYTLVAEYGENSFGGPYFRGEVGFDIAALETSSVTLPVAFVNALLSLDMDEELAPHVVFKGAVLSAEGFEPCQVSSLGDYAYVPSGVEVKVQVSAESHAGVDAADFVYSLTPEAGKAHQLICGKASSDTWPVINLPEQQTGAWSTRLYVTPATFDGEISQANRDAIVYEVIPEGSEDWSSPLVAEKMGGIYVVSGLEDGDTYQVRARVGKLTSEVKTFTVTPAALSVKSAGHVYDSGNYLTGSAVEVAFNIPSDGIMASAVGAGLVSCRASLKNSSSAEVRTISGVSGVMSDVADPWPYLPKGDYNLSASYSFNGGESVNVPVEGSSVVSMQLPEFAVNVTAYTSYDKYLASAPAQANACDPHTLYDAGASWTIAPELMANSKYSKSLVINFNGDTSRSYSGTSLTSNSKYTSIGGLSWTSYTHGVTVTFDGKVVEVAPKTHYITGLPYNQARAIAGSSDWSVVTKTADFGSDYVKLSSAGGSPAVASKSFNIPGDINVTLYAKIGKGGTATWHTGNCIQYSASGSRGSTALSSNSGSEASAQTSMSSTYNRWLVVAPDMVWGMHIRFYYMCIEYR